MRGKKVASGENYKKYPSLKTLKIKKIRIYAEVINIIDNMVFILKKCYVWVVFDFDS